MSATMNRRQFLYTGAVATAGILAGCAVNPVTGQSQLMLMSPQQEIEVDRQNAPHQFSADYGKADDKALQNYVNSVGKDLAKHTHRPDMPYNFSVVNATYVNAYAFPGGSIAATRGIMVSLENEAELGALLGHEVGHVNARHTSSRMSKALVLQGLAAGLTIGVSASEYKSLTPLAAGLGAIGAGALLAHYSREDERQADALGMEYMVKTGYSPQGMVGLQQHLVDMHDRTPSALEVMFSSHPMSEERRDTAQHEAQTTYASSRSLPLQRERYMDSTAPLRKLKPAIEEMQAGEKFMSKKQYAEAEKHFNQALKLAPDDYTGLLLMSKCQLALGNKREGERYAELAKQANPGEAQALHVAGLAKLQQGNYDAALSQFSRYERALPGNPNTLYYEARALDGMGRRDEAARQYYRYLQSGSKDANAKQSYSRLQSWGYIK
ncbi:MAG: M48 family metalloprotease [Proteobacteria bacterium]|nr:M48 family metalloprotease [Pseudomonadota bacterium]